MQLYAGFFGNYDLNGNACNKIFLFFRILVNLNIDYMCISLCNND